MKIITVSRQFSSGGRELAKRMADALGFDYYDKEIIDEIAKNKNLDSDYVEKVLSSGSYKAIPLHFARSFSFFTYADYGKAELLVEEKKVIEEIAKRGRDFIIVGRNADILLRKYNPLNIFVCASLESRIDRCIKKATDNVPTIKEIQKQIKQIDKERANTRAIISETKWGECTNYHLTINTTGWEIKELTPLTTKMVSLFFGE